MATPWIVKIGPREALAGLTWEFGDTRPDGIGRTDPHLVFAGMATGVKRAEADGLAPLALLVSNLCESKLNDIDTGSILWALRVEVLSPNPPRDGSATAYVSGVLYNGVPSADPERLYSSLEDLIIDLPSRLKDEDCNLLLLSDDIADLIASETKVVALSADELAQAKAETLEALAPILSRPMRIVMIVAALLAGIYVAMLTVFAPEDEDLVAVQHVALQVDHAGFVAGCKEARAKGFPVPLGWEEASSGCALAGTADAAVSALPVTGGAIAYRHYRLVAGHDLTIAAIVADYLFEDWEGLLSIEGGDVYVARAFDVALLPYVYEGSAQAFTTRVKDAFLGTTDRFQEARVGHVSFVTQMTMEEAMARLAPLKGAELKRLRRKDTSLDIEIIQATRILRPITEGGADGFKL